MRSRKAHRNPRPAFTILEMLLVVGMLGIIAAIVISAINPSTQLESAQDSKRNIEKRELENAIMQYVIDGNSIVAPPNGRGNAVNVCQTALTGVSCTGAGTGYDLSALVPDYIVGIPTDPLETGTRTSGYGIYRDGSFNKICSMVEEGCGS